MVLRQRNRVLAEGKVRGTLRTADLEPWTTSLVQRAARVFERRNAFILEFRRYVEDAYGRIAGSDEHPELMYVPSGMRGIDGESGDPERWMAREIERQSREEQRRGRTLVGPHRDDLRFSLGGREMQEYGSQGQHKTFLIALKIAEYFYLRERGNEIPIFLLDDVFSELDARRSRQILTMIPELGQTIVTATEESLFHGAVAWNGRHRRYIVEGGNCRHA
jgi:DNA replication and repair protein RecF